MPDLRRARYRTVIASDAMPVTGARIRIEFPAHVDVCDLIHLMTDHLGQAGGLDEEARHWVDVAVREGVVNAVRHGCNRDCNKRITVELGLEPPDRPSELVVRVIDPGDGFDPDDVADPLSDENILKPGGRGIFFMRRLMDDVTLRRPPGGGMEVRMVKKLGAAG